MNCGAHKLNLVVQNKLFTDGKGIVHGTLKSCRKLVGHFKHSNLACERLEVEQKQLGLPKHKLLQVSILNQSYSNINF